jgi:hypothetical protein
MITRYRIEKLTIVAYGALRDAVKRGHTVKYAIRCCLYAAERRENYTVKYSTVIPYSMMYGTVWSSLAHCELFNAVLRIHTYRML